MSDEPSIDISYYCTVLPVPDQEARDRVDELVEGSAWVPDHTMDGLLPGFQALRADLAESSDGVEVTATSLFGDVIEKGFEAPRITAYLDSSSGIVDMAQPIFNLAPTPGIGDITNLFPGSAILPGTGSQPAPASPVPPPTSPIVTVGTAGAKPPTGDGKAEDGKADEKDEADAPDTAPAEAPVPPPSAATIAAAAAAFPDPSALWAHITTRNRDPLAQKLIEGLYRDRSVLGKRAEWAVAPELVLLEACAEGEREELAKALFEVRTQLTEADGKLREARAGLAEKEVELAGKNVDLAEKRVQLAGKGVDLAGEMHAQMQKWTALADKGISFLIATTIFSMVAVGYLLMVLVPDGDVGEVAAPIIVFALALFAVSPAVLLLRERPLAGLDKWTPSGDVEGGEEEEKEASDGKAKDPAATE